MTDRLEAIKRHPDLDKPADGIVEIIVEDVRWLIAEIERLRAAMEDGQDFDGPDDIDYDAETLSEQCDKALEEKRG